MRLLSVGGGSGGHVTPVLAVINELSDRDPELVAAFVCDKGFESQSRGKMSQARVDVSVHVISAGKLRRYYGESWVTRFFDIKTNFRNVVDIGKILFGFVQSLVLLKKFKPDIVFAKGGFVCLPLGFAANVLGIPIIIHDSDTRPGLTNRILSRYAKRIATGSPVENYPYPTDKTVYTGVPIDPRFYPLSPAEQRSAKERIEMHDPSRPLVVVTGGGLGARTINRGIMAAAQELIEGGFEIYHVTGVKQYGEVKSHALQNPSYHIVDFVYDDIVDILGAADIVVSRASATFLQELAALGKPAVIVPAAHLSDQVKNAKVYDAARAVIVLDDATIADGVALAKSVIHFYANPTDTAQMAQRLHDFAKPDAAKDVAQLIISTYAELEHS